MYNSKSAIALIPARGGSKGLPGKNIRPICGRPLIGWSIQRATESKYLDCICVTTDDATIADVARASGAEVPFLRPAELATDEAPTLAAVEHALNFYADKQGRSFDYVVLLEPTSPLRHPGDIDAMLTRLIENEGKYDAIVSIGEVAEHPAIVKRKVSDRLEPYCADLKVTTRRQDNPPAYFPYGVAYIVKTETLLRERSFYPERATFFEIRRYQTYEIDDMYDLLCVEAVMKHEWGIM
jgi:CMP-N,N'-diacetyllegionaminic acid synthase